MLISKILNNNVAVVQDEHGKESVVMGCGIAFGKRVGSSINEKKVEKVFTISDSSLSARFQQLVADIPTQHLMMCERAINFAKIDYGKKLNDCIYITLTDHVSYAIQRYKQGIKLENPLLWDVKRFYHDEYMLGLKVSDIVKEETGIEFLEDEAAFVAMHFVNAQLGNETSAVYDLTYVIQEICQLVKDFFHLQFNEESLAYYRFITHVKFFAQRMRTGQHYDDDNIELLEIISLKYPRAYECAVQIKHFVEEKHDYDVGSEELLYLTAHIARITKKGSEYEDDDVAAATIQ